MAAVGRVFATATVVAYATTIAFAVAPDAGATTVLWAGGTRGSLGELLPDDFFGDRGSFLGGAYTNDTFTNLDYPASLWPITGPIDPTLGDSVANGIAGLAALAKSTLGQLVVAGTSQGALVVQGAAAILNADLDIPSATKFMIIADPNLGLLRSLYGVRVPIWNYTPQPLPETRFDTVVVINQYDWFADAIADPFNVLTIANSLMGIVYVHAYAQNSDLSLVPTENITTTTNSQGGTLTKYFVPTERLPLTTPLRQLLVPTAIVDGIDNVLRPIIDAGYSRDVPSPPLESPPQVSVSRASTMSALQQPSRQRNTADVGAAATTARDSATATLVQPIAGETAANRRSATAGARLRDSSSPAGAAGRSAPR